jgi:HK97 family phage portal protein
VFADFGAGPISGIGSFVNVRMAENVAAVVACVNAIAGPVSSVPARVMREIEGGREPAPTHPVSRLIEAPNARQTWPDWLQFTIGQYLTHGNSISLIERDDAGRPIALIPLPWQGIQVQLLQSGRLAFDTMMQTFPWSSTGTPLRRLFEDEVFWLKGRTDDGYLGRSVLARAPAVLKAALGIQEMTSTLWDNAAIPSGIIKHPGVLSPEAKTSIGNTFAERFQGAKNSGKVPVFEEGMTFEATAMSPEDNEVLQSRRFSGEEIFRLFGVPPPLAGDFQFGSFQNAETAGRWHSSLCLAVHCRAIEAEFQRSLFGADSDYHLMIDLSGLQRGDDAARWQTYALAIENGILTVNEIRKIEGFNPLPPGGVPPGAAAGTSGGAPGGPAGGFPSPSSLNQPKPGRPVV